MCQGAGRRLGRQKALRSGGNHFKREKKRGKKKPAGRVSGLAEGGEGDMLGLTKASAGLQQADGHLPDQRREATRVGKPVEWENLGKERAGAGLTEGETRSGNTPSGGCGKVVEVARRYPGPPRSSGG
jgi:hypothetical protein